MRNKITVFIVAMVLTTTARALPQHEFPATMNSGATVLQRCSVATVKALKFIKVGYASLYAADCARLMDTFADNEKIISFQYFRSIPGDAFAKAAAHFLQKNLSAEEYARMEQKVQTFNSHYQDIQRGDRYDLFYSPTRGISLALNESPLFAELDAEFAQAYMQIWFGAEPFDHRLKATLLSLPKADKRSLANSS